MPDGEGRLTDFLRFRGRNGIEKLAQLESQACSLKVPVEVWKPSELDQSFPTFTEYFQFPEIFKSYNGQTLWYFQVMDCENWILALWNSAEPYALKLFNLIDHNSDFSQFDKVWEIIQQETTIDLKPFPSQKEIFLLFSRC